MKKKQSSIRILDNRKIGDCFFKLSVRSLHLAKSAKPGQFVMCKAGQDSFLRRPLGIHAVAGERVDFLYKVVGPGTQWLSGKKFGEEVNVLGPLGKGFDYSNGLRKDAQVLLVAGGMGVAPLLFFAQKFSQDIKRRQSEKPLVLIGAKTKSHILCAEEFKKYAKVSVATDDGTFGFNGRVGDLLEEAVAGSDPRKVYVYACGPQAMLKAVASLCFKRGIASQVSLEAHMACGIGACLGCVVDTTAGYKRVCKDGPVFSGNEILWK